MSNTEKLDELFGLARNEPSLFSEEEMCNLLEENNISCIPAKVNFVELIKGVPTMLKLGFAIAIATIGGLISTTFFDNFEQQIVQNQTKSYHYKLEKQIPVESNQLETENVPDDDPKVRKDVLIKKEIKAEVKGNTQTDVHTNPPEDITNKEKTLESATTFKPVEVKGIQFITLSQEKLELLGINTTNNELKYWNNWGTHEEKATLCTLFVNGGLGIKPKNNLDYELIPNPGISPRLITDNKGNRRVFVIDDKENEHVIINSQYDQKMTLSDSQQVAMRTIVSNRIDSNTSDFKLNLHPILNLKKLQDKNLLLKLPKNIDSTMKFDNTALFEEIDRENDLTEKERDGIKKALGNLFDDSIRVILKKTNTVGVNIDEENEVIESKNSSFIKIDINTDTTFINDDNMFLNDSVSIKEMQIPNFSSFEIDSKPVLISSNGQDIFDMESNIDEYIKINKLIPILVPFGKVNSDNELIDKENFGFVLWYDPTPEILNVLPEEIKSKILKELDSYSKADDVCQSTAIAGEEPYLEVWRSCSGAIEHLNLSPIPANSHINVNYSLKESRRTTISIHDMFGNVVKELQSDKSELMGNQSYSFDIRKFESGMYLISVQTDNGEAAVQRFVIER